MSLKQYVPVPHRPIQWASAEICVCAKHDDCWVIPGGEHTSSRNRAVHCARELADLIGPEVSARSNRGVEFVFSPPATTGPISVDALERLRSIE
jgi:hypothetical protein